MQYCTKRRYTSTPRKAWNCTHSQHRPEHTPDKIVKKKTEATHGRLPLTSTIGRNAGPKSCSPSHASHFPITMANTQSTALLQELLSFKKQHVIHSSYDIFQLQYEVLTEELVKWCYASYISKCSPLHYGAQTFAIPPSLLMHKFQATELLKIHFLSY